MFRSDREELGSPMKDITNLELHTVKGKETRERYATLFCFSSGKIILFDFRSLGVGSLVFAKLGKDPPWPAVIEYVLSSTDQYFVKFFGCNQVLILKVF